MITKLFKQTVILICLSVTSISLLAQHSTAHAKSSGSSLSAEKSKMLCKAWKVDTISEYGVDNPAKGKEVNDGITFVADGTLFMTWGGVASTGKWTYSGGRINTETTNPDNKLSFRIISLADGRMVLEYQYPAPDLSREQYTFSPKKQN